MPLPDCPSQSLSAYDYAGRTLSEDFLFSRLLRGLKVSVLLPRVQLAPNPTQILAFSAFQFAFVFDFSKHPVTKSNKTHLFR